MRSKILVIVVALILGGIAAVLAANYLRSARTDIAAESEPVVVLVASEDLPRGLSAEELISKGLVVEQEVPRRFVAADAVSSERAIANQVLAVPVSAGEQLTKTRFQYPSQAGLSYTVPEDFVAVSISVDDVTGVSGLLKPGDNVVVYATFKPEGQDAEGESTPDFTMTAISRAKVLAIGAETSAEPSTSSNDQEDENAGLLASNRAQNESGAGGEGNYRTVTLALSVEDGQRTVFAAETGSIYLALLPRNAEEPAKPSPSTLGAVAGSSLKAMVP